MHGFKRLRTLYEGLGGGGLFSDLDAETVV